MKVRFGQRSNLPSYHQTGHEISGTHLIASLSEPRRQESGTWERQRAALCRGEHPIT